MKHNEPVDFGQQDLFRSRLAQIIDMNHEFMVVAGYMDWDRLAEACGRTYSDKLGHPALPTRLMGGTYSNTLAITRTRRTVGMKFRHTVTRFVNDNTVRFALNTEIDRVKDFKCNRFEERK